MNIRYYITITTLICIASCLQFSINTDENTSIMLYSKAIDGCQNNSDLERYSNTDNLQYEYFHDSLVIKVLVEANCCPEINRFKTSVFKSNDTLNLEVRDVEEQQCHCICSYEIQTVYKSTGIDSIYFTCEYISQNLDSLIISELICRNVK